MNKASELESDEFVMLEVWNNGRAGNPEEPCGETDVIRISGNRLWLEFLVKLRNPHQAFEWLGDLPTEVWLDVKARICYDEEFYLEVESYSYLKREEIK